jgi:hypothetical protein
LAPSQSRQGRDYGVTRRRGKDDKPPKFFNHIFFLTLRLGVFARGISYRILKTQEFYSRQAAEPPKFFNHIFFLTLRLGVFARGIPIAF